MEHEFKAGDWVRILDTGFRVSGDIVKNSILQIESLNSVNTSYNWSVIFTNDAWGGCYDDHPITNYLKPALPHEIPENQQQEINLQIGDTFRNSVGNKKEIVDIRGWEYIIEDCDTYKRSYGIMRFEIEDHIKSGKYTDYTPVSQQKTVKQWKKEDFYNTKIVVDTPEKSRRFQELLFSLGLKWCGPNPYKIHNESFIYGLIVKSGNRNISYYRVEDKALFITNNAYKEIFYNEIFNENNNQLNNNQNGNKENNNNDVLGKNFSGNGSKETATAISFRRTSKIATSSGYTGNKIKGRRVDTKIGRSEISFSAISI